MRRKTYGKITEERVSWRDFMKAFWHLLALGGVRGKYVLAIILLFLILLYAVVPPLILGAVINFFTGYQSGDSLIRFYWLTAFLGGSMAIVAFFRLNTKNWLSRLRNKTVYSIRTKAFEVLLSQSLLESAKENTGAKAQRIQNGTDAFTVFFYLVSNNILPSIASLSGIVAVFLALKPSYAIFFIIYGLLFFGILKFFTARISKLNVERNAALEQASGAYVEGLHNISALKAAGSEEAFHGRIQEREEVSRHFADTISRTGNHMWKTFQTMNGLGVAVFLWLVGMDVVRGILNIGQIVVFYTYFRELTTLANQTLESYGDLLQAKAGIARLEEIFSDTENAEKKTAGFPEDWEMLTVTNGNFDYPRGPALTGINLQIKKGEKIGIIGKTGSGKSTLVKILLGLLPLRKGTYAIGTTDFSSIRKEEIFRHISFVPQEVEMFNMSLRENITLYRDISEKTLHKALETAQLSEVMESLPEGLDTLIGEKGYKLSGGERQRVGIARALCQETDIIILDEATSALDTNTEKAFYDALGAQYPHKTVIAIAHRIHTLEKTHRIYTIEEGKIVKEGTYTEII